MYNAAMKKGLNNILIRLFVTLYVIMNYVIYYFKSITLKNMTIGLLNITIALLGGEYKKELNSDRLKARIEQGLQFWNY